MIRNINSSSSEKFIKKKGIKFVHQNIRVLLNNKPHLETFIAKTHGKIDFISLSETHRNSDDGSDNDDLYKIPGYKFIHNDPKIGKGGGVGIFVKEGVDFKRRKDLEISHIESLWIEICIYKTKSILLKLKNQDLLHIRKDLQENLFISFSPKIFSYLEVI